MVNKLNLITGATGLLGSHVAEQLRQRGENVRAFVRPGANIEYLRQLGVEIVYGDLLIPTSIGPSTAGADIVYHCAARIGNWGSWHDFRTLIIDSTGNLLDCCRSAGVGRVLFVSSLAAYGHPQIPADGLITEDEPLGQRLGFLDYYSRAKMQAELLVRELGARATIVRPSWIFGPRDRNTMPRLVQALRARWGAVVGTGDNLLNLVYAGDVADGAIRAANHPGAAGQAYHLSSEGSITQRQFFDFLTDALKLPRVTRHVSERLASLGGLLGEIIARVLRWRRSPHATRYGIRLLTRSTRFSIAKARRDLGWQPLTNTQEGLQRTLDWFLSNA